MKNRLVLASESPRRSEMLRNLGFDFDVIPSGVKEHPLQEEIPREHVIRLAEAKAMEIGKRFPDRWVIAADTIVLINGSILGKPENEEEALEMLSGLSGREHLVWTGFSVQHLGKGKGGHEAVRTAVRVKPLLPAEMKWYVHTGEPFDKAGGYAIQGIGSFMIESIQGSYTNVVGLPLCELIQMLTRLEAITISDCGFRIED
ncbi:MAG: septum formation protein Maf [Deltaproteobacteria bacterium]|nr:MAG: septum formation protein Maf [Deltaproteobacteria bacterium]